MKIALAFFEQLAGVSGGIERVLCNMANAMTARGHDVSIMYCQDQCGAPFYPLHPPVKLYNLMAIHPEKWNHKDFRQCMNGRERIIREAIRLFSKTKAIDYNESVKGRLIGPDIREIMERVRPDIIVSFRYETSHYLLHFAHVGVPVITMFHTSPDVILPRMPGGERRAIQDSRAAQVLLRRDVPVVERFCSDARVIYIPNAVPQYGGEADLKKQKEIYTVLHVGRLHKTEKRQHLIIEAFARLSGDFPHWQVELWGGSVVGDSYKEELRRLIAHHHLENRVFLKGESTDMERVYSRADLFCFPSAFEGFGLAMAEAMSKGLPVVAYRSCPAVNELVRHGETGLLAEDGVEGLARALRVLMENQAERIRMGAQARADMRAYAPERIWNRWEEVMKKAVKGEPMT